MAFRSLLVPLTLIVSALPLAVIAMVFTQVPAGAKPKASSIKDTKAESCLINEALVYSCDFGNSTKVEVCASSSRINYRFFRRKHMELEIRSNGRDGKVHYGFIRGGGAGGNQWDLRFSNGHVNYIVFTAEAGSASGWPGHTTSGLVAMRGDATVSQKVCRRLDEAQRFSIGKIPRFVPKDTDQRYLVWY